MDGGSSKGAEERRPWRGVARREEAPTGQHGTWRPAGGGGGGGGGQDRRTLGMGRGAGAPWRGGGLEELVAAGAARGDDRLGLLPCGYRRLFSPTINEADPPGRSFLIQPFLLVLEMSIGSPSGCPSACECHQSSLPRFPFLLRH